MVSVIIVNYNSANCIVNCCNSFLEFEEVDSYEIIIVDNKSSDVNILREYVISSASMNIRLIENPLNYGFGKACNIGSRSSSGDYLFFLNPDTYLTKSVLNEFVLFFNNYRDYKIACLSSSLKHSDGSICHSYGSFMWPLNWNLRKYKRQIFTLQGLRFVDVCVGSNIFFKRSTFEHINGFDENIFLYQEELELQYRLRILGYDSFLIEDVGIVHIKGVSSSNLYQRQSMVISDAYIIKKHCTLAVYLLFRLYTILMALFFLKNPSVKMSEKLLYLKSSFFLKYF